MQETIRDNYLGTLKYNRKLKSYEGKIKDNLDNEIEFGIDVDENLAELIIYTRQLLKKYLNRDYELKLYAARQLLDIYNDTWNETDIEITEREFASKMLLEGITVYSDRFTTFYYQDGDLFYGHSITIYLDESRNLESAQIEG